MLYIAKRYGLVVLTVLALLLSGCSKSTNVKRNNVSGVGVQTNAASQRPLLAVNNIQTSYGLIQVTDAERVQRFTSKVYGTVGHIPLKMTRNKVVGTITLSPHQETTLVFTGDPTGYWNWYEYFDSNGRVTTKGSTTAFTVKHSVVALARIEVTIGNYGFNNAGEIILGTADAKNTGLFSSTSSYSMKRRNVTAWGRLVGHCPPLRVEGFHINSIDPQSGQVILDVYAIARIGGIAFVDAYYGEPGNFFTAGSKMPIPPVFLNPTCTPDPNMLSVGKK